MAMNYEMPQNGFTPDNSNIGMADVAMMGSILGDVTAKITVETEEMPDDYTGVPKKKKTVEEVDVAAMMPGPAPMMMNMGPPPPMMGGMMPQMPQMPQPQQMQQPMSPSLGVQAAQSVMPPMM